MSAEPCTSALLGTRSLLKDASALSRGQLCQAPEVNFDSCRKALHTHAYICTTANRVHLASSNSFFFCSCMPAFRFLCRAASSRASGRGAPWRCPPRRSRNSSSRRSESRSTTSKVPGAAPTAAGSRSRFSLHNLEVVPSCVYSCVDGSLPIYDVLAIYVDVALEERIVPSACTTE